MMRIGIVGSEAAKFTPQTEGKAREYIRKVLAHAEVVISGGCHLGGIDIWAVQEAERLGFTQDRIVEHKPKRLTWTGGYQDRNLRIANDSDVVVCITVKELPEGYTGMRFPQGCYHCGTGPEDHVKSGGCWTAKQARRMGKRTRLEIIA